MTTEYKIPPSPLASHSPLARHKQVGSDHYKTLAIQPVDYILQNHLGWCEGNAIKYITRHAKKGGKEDLLKAIHYLEMAMEHQYPGYQDTELADTYVPTFLNANLDGPALGTTHIPRARTYQQVLAEEQQAYNTEGKPGC